MDLNMNNENKIKHITCVKQLNICTCYIITIPMTFLLIPTQGCTSNWNDSKVENI